MIKWQDAIREARLLIGTPYSVLDCINLLKKVIRTAPGGVPGYTTAGTNSLWKSFEMSAKYRDLTERHEGIENVPAGAIPFKRDGSNVHHAGIATGKGTVIHSSSTQNGRGVVETPLTAEEGWNCWGVHRHIMIMIRKAEEDNMDTLYRAKVITQEDPLTLRNAPEGDKIGELPIGAIVDVLVDTGGDWLFVRLGGMSGYAAKRYLARTEEEPEEEEVAGAEIQIVITDEAGNVFRPVGAYKTDIEVLVDGESID